MIDCDIVYIVKIFYKTSNVEFIIKNIKFFNKNNNIILLLNISEYLFDKLNISKLKSENPNIRLFRCKAYRTKFDPHVISCVTHCMNYIVENINCKYIFLNHDSEIYVKQVDIDIIKNNMIQCTKKTFNKNEIISTLTVNGDNTFWWKRFMELENMFNYFIHNEITPLINVCPGLVLPYETLQKILKDLNNINNDYYLNSEKRVLLDEIVYYSFMMHYSCKYYNSNHTYWINDKREGLKSEEETLEKLKADLSCDQLKNIFSIKKSYKSVCNFVEFELMRENT